ncbi:hypothetical protein [Allomesorhizobium camelthorni]|uniref:Uncharacterized protein n=1 Tax=Allomesorhizobium camelthorni TaxID=475069 RepID=A0A6G4WPE5_9HYPH|nr:hypothetical protein [Mesorhizobium camelthorni]NGO55980.1 hypothetical protein [Mesorhizobium camelthorni]
MRFFLAAVTFGPVVSQNDLQPDADALEHGLDGLRLAVSPGLSQTCAHPSIAKTSWAE